LEDDDETDEEIDQHHRPQQSSKTAATGAPASDDDENSQIEEEMEPPPKKPPPSNPAKPLKNPRRPMQKDEPKNFLYLAAALSIFLATEIQVEQIELGEHYLERYLTGYLKVNPSLLSLFLTLLIYIDSSMEQM
jgi:hypothetical protein